MSKKLVVGLLAHVDAGKTTLSEALCFMTSTIARAGRVDHQDTYLDYNDLERQRGITIYSKPAVIHYHDCDITLLDTPGHMDFSSEMERALDALDVAILVISGTDLIQAHTKQIFKLIQAKKIPMLVFVNKMDISHYSKDDIITALGSLSSNFIDIKASDFHEQIATLDDDYLDAFLNQKLDKTMIYQAFYNQMFYPIFFGSAMKLEGVLPLLGFLEGMEIQRRTDLPLKALVYKIQYEKQHKLAFMKIIQGELKLKETYLASQKVEEIRLYSGLKFQNLKQAEAGMVVAVRGLSQLQAGDVLGGDSTINASSFESCMTYDLVFDSKEHIHEIYQKIKVLNEEDPNLKMTLKDCIQISLMGDMQIEILRQTIKDRFDLDCEIVSGRVIYKETIKHRSLGVGHYEPLRHYAEVHLLLEPLKRGSGVVICSELSEEELSKNYQNQILYILATEKVPGLLTGSELTDIKITLVAGKSHQKHTEGGDFRQATLRALRQGLYMNESMILEPYYRFEASLPLDAVSTFIFHMDQKNASYELVDETHIRGRVAISAMQGYFQTLRSYTKGHGTLDVWFDGYEPVANEKQVQDVLNYHYENDLLYPTSSVFCLKGAGYEVKASEVYEKMHLPSPYLPKKQTKTMIKDVKDEDLMTIFESVYGKVNTKTYDQFGYRKKEAVDVSVTYRPLCIIVDGYNLIHASPELKKLFEENLDSARSRLIDLLANYQGYKRCLMIIVFDAYLVKENPGTIERYHDFFVVYTKEAQTADAFIERTSKRMAKDFQIQVVTSDYAEQLVVLGHGATRVSSREFLIDMEYTTKTKFKEFQDKQKVDKDFLLEEVKHYGK